MSYKNLKDLDGFNGVFDSEEEENRSRDPDGVTGLKSAKKNKKGVLVESCSNSAKSFSSKSGLLSEVEASTFEISSEHNDSFLFECRKRSISHFNPNRRSPFDSLPNELVFRIFTHLGRATLIKCALTCKRFRMIAYNELFWKDVNFSATNVSPGWVGHALSRGAQVMCLAQCGVASPILSMADGCPEGNPSKLEYLDLSMAVIQVTDLQSLLSTCFSLKKVSLQNCQLSQCILETLGSQNYQSLTVLNLSMTSGITESGVRALLSKCSKLAELDFSWTDAVEAALKALAESISPNVQKLNISGYRSILNDDLVLRVVRRCQSLSELDISDCSRLTDKVILSIVHSLRRIESLSVSRCYGISPSIYSHLTSLPKLKYFNVFGVLREADLNVLKSHLSVDVNKVALCSIARPRGDRDNAIWGRPLKCRQH